MIWAPKSIVWAAKSRVIRIPYQCACAVLNHLLDSKWKRSSVAETRAAGTFEILGNSRPFSVSCPGAARGVHWIRPDPTRNPSKSFGKQAFPVRQQTAMPAGSRRTVHGSLVNSFDVQAKHRGKLMKSRGFTLASRAVPRLRRGGCETGHIICKNL